MDKSAQNPQKFEPHRNYQPHGITVYCSTQRNGPCQFFTQYLLANPNDGATELKRDKLPGGTWVSHTLGECHSSGSLMRYPSQVLNATRNSEMNKHAA